MTQREFELICRLLLSLYLGVGNVSAPAGQAAEDNLHGTMSSLIPSEVQVDGLEGMVLLKDTHTHTQSPIELDSPEML